MSYSGTNKFSEATADAQGLVFPTSIQPKTFAAGSGVLPVGMMVAYNKATGKWEPVDPTPVSPLVITLTTLGSTASGGLYRIIVNGEATANIAHVADDQDIAAALLALGNIDAGDIQVAEFNGFGSSTELVLTFTAQFLRRSGYVVTVGTYNELEGIGDLLLLPGEADSLEFDLRGSDPEASELNLISGIVWPHPITLSPGGDTIGNVMLKGKIHLSSLLLNGHDAADIPALVRSQELWLSTKGLAVVGMVKYSG